MLYILYLFSLYFLQCEGLTPIYIGIRAENQDRYFLIPPVYENEALEPYFSEALVTYHHEVHGNYLRQELNSFLVSWRGADKWGKFARSSLYLMLRNIEALPAERKGDFEKFGAGWANHLLYFSVISPNPTGEAREPQGEIAEDINRYFNSFTQFKEDFIKLTTEIAGSGYVWLCRTGTDKLILVKTEAEKSPLSRRNHPILGIDLWEHAYLTQFGPDREQYIENWWILVDWEQVAILDKWWKDPKLFQKRKSDDTDHEEL